MRPLLPSGFFVTCGKGLSTISPLNAFDKALLDAGIAQCNLVPVSSIIPRKAKLLTRRPLTKSGMVTFCVLARTDGKPGQQISAAIGWLKEEGKSGVVAESSGNPNDVDRDREVTLKLEEMARMRGADSSRKHVAAVSLDVPQNSYGCTIAALVFK